MIIINFSKAQEITKDRVRTERKPLLEEQDVLFQRALEAGTNTAEIIMEKQRLRDVTKFVDSALNLDELKRITVFPAPPERTA